MAGLRAGAPVALTGTAEPGARVQLFDGDKLLGETTAGPDGKWTLDLPALAAGGHSLTAQTTGADGAAAASQPVTFDLPQAAAAPAFPAPYTIKLAPGETVTVPVRGFCMNYGKPFPGKTLAAADLVPDKVQAAIGYALQKGYVDSDPLQVQLAVWTLADGKRIPNQKYTLADEIIKFAEGAASPTPAGAQTLDAAVGKKLVSATIADYRSTSPTSYTYRGAGSLAVKNLSQDALTVTLPYGVRFTDTGRQGTQDMAIFPTPGQ